MGNRGYGELHPPAYGSQRGQSLRWKYVDRRMISDRSNEDSERLQNAYVKNHAPRIDARCVSAIDGICRMRWTCEWNWPNGVGQNGS